MPDRAILHCDLNCCYAQIECQRRPELRGAPLAVGGSEEARRGIVLAKNLLAKDAGVKTADTLAEARRKCPGLAVVPPDYPCYMKTCAEARRIYCDYSDLAEGFGPDGAWVDVTGSPGCLGMSPAEIARGISERTKAELGLTVSVGVSWNKVFAKFGSDHRKPDAITEVTRANYRDLVWRAPVGDLLYVGRATQEKLRASGIATIGDLAHASDYYLRRRLGKPGFVLRSFALGQDASEVKHCDPERRDVEREAKSFGNGVTFPRDIEDPRTAKAVAWMLADGVARRMREARFLCGTVSVGVRSAGGLSSHARQAPTPAPTNATAEVAGLAWDLLRENEPLDEGSPIRALSVRASGLVPAERPRQGRLFDPFPERARHERLDAAVDDLRRRFGDDCVVWGPKALDADAWGMDAKADNAARPVSFFRR